MKIFLSFVSEPGNLAVAINEQIGVALVGRGIQQNEICSICMVNLVERVLNCMHKFCLQCLQMWQGRTCPECQVPY